MGLIWYIFYLLPFTTQIRKVEFEWLQILSEKAMIYPINLGANIKLI